MASRTAPTATAFGGRCRRRPRGGSTAVDDSEVTARTILHVDLDAFFAAVEQRDRPELRGRPVVVGGPGGEYARGVVSAASYEARRFGIHSAMSLREAYRRCPDAVFLPVDGRRYQAASREVMAILRRYTPLVEPISIDEAFLDVTGSAILFGDGPTIARRIKDDVRAEVGLTASVGVASTKLVAKIASDLRKPDGLVVVPLGEEAAFLAPLPIGRLWGVGDKTAVALRDYSVRTIGDLAALAPDLWSAGSASTARRSSIALAGSTPIRSTRATRPSRSATSTPSTSTRATREVIERTLLGMADGVAGRLRSAGVRAGTVAVKIRDSSFRTITRQRTLAEPTDMTGPIYATALELARPEIRGMRVRLLGVTASNLGEREQLGAVRRDRAAAAPGDRGRRRHPPSIRRGHDHAGAAAPGGPAGAIRARPAQPARSAGPGRPDRGRRCRCAADGARDTLGGTDVDDIPPDDA